MSSTSSHLKLLHPFQSLQIRHKSDSIFQRPEKLHLELHHLPEVTEQNVQLQHTGHHSDTATTLRALSVLKLCIYNNSYSFFLMLGLYRSGRKYLILSKEALFLQRRQVALYKAAQVLKKTRNMNKINL